MLASNAHAVLSRYPYHAKAGCHVPAARIGGAFFVFFKFSSWGTVLQWWAVSVESFTSLVYQKPEGSSLSGLGKDFSELEERRKISEERSEILEG